jgi:hypothetical protein
VTAFGFQNAVRKKGVNEENFEKKNEILLLVCDLFGVKVQIFVS